MGRVFRYLPGPRGSGFIVVVLRRKRGMREGVVNPRTVSGKLQALGIPFEHLFFPHFDFLPSFLYPNRVSYFDFAALSR